MFHESKFSIYLRRCTGIHCLICETVGRADRACRARRVCNDSLGSLWQSMNPTAFGLSFPIPNLYIGSIATEAHLAVDSTNKHLKNS
jgi:hypothetical protein